MVDGRLEVDQSVGRAYVDIEVDDSRGFPREKGEHEIISVAYALPGSDGIEFVSKWDFDTEADMLDYVFSDFMANGVGVFVAYNVDFDYGHLLARAKKLVPNWAKYLSFVDVFDVYGEYKANVRGLGSYTLEDVARKEGFDVEVKARKKLVSEMTREELEEYNKNDVYLVREIDRKYGFSDVKAEIGRIVGLTFELMSPVRIGDNLILRRSRELGYVLRNTVRVEKARTYEGAYVMEPKRLGLIRGVAVYDVESMYPNIIINRGIDVGEFRGEILPKIEEMLLKRRREYKRLYKETGKSEYYIKQWAYKILANALYGLLGTVGFRYYDISKASEVTAEGRKIAKRIAESVGELGFEVVYQDTDSAFVEIGLWDEDVVSMVEKWINEIIRPYRVKFEEFGDLLIFSKKRYILKTRDGRMVFKGVETRRGDWDDLTKMVVARVIEMMFEGKGRDEIYRWLAEVKVGMYRGEYDEMLVITKSIDRAKKYKVIPEHVRAWRKLRERGWDTPFDRVMYVYYGGDVEPLRSRDDVDKYRGRLNYSRYWEKLKGVVDRYVSVLEEKGVRKLVFG